MPLFGSAFRGPGNADGLYAKTCRFGKRARAWRGDFDLKTNVVMLMTDDTDWNDFGAYGGGRATLVAG